MNAPTTASDGRESRAEFWGARVGLLGALALATGWLEALIVWVVNL